MNPVTTRNKRDESRYNFLTQHIYSLSKLGTSSSIYFVNKVFRKVVTG